MATFRMTGMDDLQKEFKRMEKAAKDLSKQKSVPFSDLFTSSFMRKYTSFSSFDELLDAGGFHVETDSDFEAIPDDLFDSHIAATTKFKSWRDMIDTATKQYISKKLGF